MITPDQRLRWAARDYAAAYDDYWTAGSIAKATGVTTGVTFYDAGLRARRALRHAALVYARSEGYIATKTDGDVRAPRRTAPRKETR